MDPDSLTPARIASWSENVSQLPEVQIQGYIIYIIES